MGGVEGVEGKGWGGQHFVVVWLWFADAVATTRLSLTLFSPCCSTMFSGFRSLWMILFLWRYVRAEAGRREDRESQTGPRLKYTIKD